MTEEKRTTEEKRKYDRQFVKSRRAKWSEAAQKLGYSSYGKLLDAIVAGEVKIKGETGLV